MIPVPMYLKKSVGRTLVHHPTRVTSVMIRNELLQLGVLGPNADPASVAQFTAQDAALGPLYESHPVTVQALREGFRREHIIPLSVYFDGVQYTQNENFLGFYVTNLRTGKQRLVWLLSTSSASLKSR